MDSFVPRFPVVCMYSSVNTVCGMKMMESDAAYLSWAPTYSTASSHSNPRGRSGPRLVPRLLNLNGVVLRL